MLQESRNDCAFFQLKKTATKRWENTPYKNQNRTRRMDPAKQLVTVWNVTVCDVVSQLVSKCSASGSVESAIWRTGLTDNAKPMWQCTFFLTGLAGKVENRSDTVILFTEDTKPFICLLLKVVFAIYLFKVLFKGYQNQVRCIKRIKVLRAVLQHSLSKPRTVTPSCDCSGAWMFGQLCQLWIFEPVVFNYG